MALEDMKSYPLNESERILKNAYETGDKTLWEKPMSFSRYEQYEREGLIVQDGIAVSQMRRNKGLCGKGSFFHREAAPTPALIPVQMGDRSLHNQALSLVLLIS